MPHVRSRADRLLAAAAFFCVALAPLSAGAADDPVAAALGRAILAPKQGLTEVADYCESNVPRMPEVKNVADWEARADKMRSDVLANVIFRGAARGWSDPQRRIEWLETIDGGAGYKIKKVRYEALPGLWIPALLYAPEPLPAGKIPVILNVNGHDANGKAADYKQVRCINQAKRGMYALNIEWLGMGQLRDGNYRHDLINHIDLCGAGGIATHFLSQQRGLDVLLSLERADPARVAVTGLSGGGWQTIFISAFDTRVKLTDPVAGYSSFRTRARFFSDLGDSEQTPCDLAVYTDYALMTAMMAPRAALLTFNEKDNCCFAAPHALPPLLDAARPIFALYGKEDRLRSHVNFDPGTHNYLKDNREALYRMLGDQFFPGVSGYDPKEIACDAELKSADALKVGLPDDNVSLFSLAMELSKGLPRNGDLPREQAAASSWSTARKARLRQVLRARDFTAQAEKTGSEEHDGLRSTTWKLKLGPWTVPVVELVKGEPKETVLLVADAGRKSLGAAATAQLAQGRRVLAVDPFYLGESKPGDHDYLWCLFIAAVGDRPLGLQASQLAAVARWAREEFQTGPLTIAATGPRAGVGALAATGLEAQAIGRVELTEPLGSLKELIESKAAYTSAPELFCFGLLEDFDVVTLAALVAPRPLVIAKAGASARALKELAPLKGWYATWGVEAEPFR